MDIELAPDDAVPEAPAPRSKTYVRERYKSYGWEAPPGNLLAVYLEACERHRVPANSGVINQLQRRVRLMQAGPWQRVCAPITPPPLPALPSYTPSSLPLPTSPLVNSAPSVSASRSTLNSPGQPSRPALISPPTPSATLSSALSPSTSHMVLAAATQTFSELRDVIQAHVHPLTLGPALHPGATGATENHAATVNQAAIKLAQFGYEGGEPMYAAAAVSYVCGLVDPRTPWEKLAATVGLRPGVRVVSEAEFARLLEAASSGASLWELRQAALEVLSRPVGHGTLDVEGLVGALFDYLDVTQQGSIPVSELRSVVAAFSPAAAADMYGKLMEQYPILGRPGGELVSRGDFVSLLVYLAPGLAPAGSSPGRVRDKTEVAINAILDAKIREPFCYDFSRCYLGPRGMLPVMETLGADSAFTSLSLASCGLGCGAVERLVDWLQGHPNLTSLDLTNNLIADRGGMALVRLLQDNPRIVELGVGSSYVQPPRPGRTHHDNLGPAACEDGGPLLAALAANRAARRSSPTEIVRALRQHGPELRALCFSLLAASASAPPSSRVPEPAPRPGTSAGRGSDGRVPLEALRGALREVTAEWGFTGDALDEVLHHERLLGTATAGRTADASGRLGVTYDELMHFLRCEDAVLRVATAVRNHLLEAKRIFYRLAPEPTTASSITPAGTAGPRTALSSVRHAILASASAPGSGWDVSEADLEHVLSPAFLRQHCRAPPTGNAPWVGVGPNGAAPIAGAYGGVTGVGSGGIMGSDGLVVSDWALAAAGGGVGGGGGGGAGGGGHLASQGSLGGLGSGGSSFSSSGRASTPPDMLISWPELCNTLLYLFNR